MIQSQIISNISTKFFNQGQSWNYERIVKCAVRGTPASLKVVIRRNAYDEQSYGRTYLWDGHKWENVVDYPIGFLKCKSVSYVAQKPSEKLFEEDFETLLGDALLILNP